MAAVDVRLGLDTAGPHLALALYHHGAGPLAQRAPKVGREHAARIVPELDALFAAANLERGAVQAVTVGIGPGSCTGLRVGIAAARAMALSWQVPLGGVDSLSLLAWAVLAPGERGVAVLDARRGNLYAAVYERTETGLQQLAAAAKRPRGELRAAWPDARWLEDVAPDASWAAMQPPGGRVAEAVYL